MRTLLAVAFWFFAVSSQAATLLWDNQTTVSPLTVEKSATATGTFVTVATLPNGATSYILTPGAYGFYRVQNTAGPSNVVQFSADLFTGPVTTRLDALDVSDTAQASRITALETTTAGLSSTLSTLPFPSQISALTARVTALETAPVVVPPSAPTSNLTVRQIDADHIEITCNGIGITTSGTGLQRVLTCKH